MFFVMNIAIDFITNYNGHRDWVHCSRIVNSHLEQLTHCFMQLNYKFVLWGFYSVSHILIYNNSSSFERYFYKYELKIS